MKALLAAALCLIAAPADAALYQRVYVGDQPFVQMSADAEAAARADPSARIGNDSGYEVLLSADQATALRAQQAPDPAAIAASGYQALIVAGVTVTSTGTPSLNATYAIGAPAQATLSAIITGIAAGQGLPGGGGTFLHPDAAGAPHAFDATQITALARAIRDFVYSATLTRGAIAAGQTASWPSSAITIP